MFETERFINEIEKRPAIYNYTSEEYNDRNAKSAAWNEVCRQMIRNWKSLSEEERHMEEKNLRGKWRNIRDYFMKELKVQKNKATAGPLSKKRKVYTHFDQLQFLIPSIENKQRRESSYLNNVTKIEESDGEADNPMFEEYEMSGNEASTSKEYVQTVNSPVSYRTLPVRHSKSMGETSINSYDNDFQEMVTNNSVQRTNNVDEDYDKMFLLSLLPTLRKIPDDKKLDVRIQMQRILASVLYPSARK